MKIILLFVFILVIISAVNIHAQEKTFEVYGFTMMDAGYNFKTINPDWYDVLRVTKLPSYKKEFAPDGKVFYSVRQTRFGVKSHVPTNLGNFNTKFEFELFGVGANAGQTALRLRHAYGELGHVLAGQTNSTFMDGDVFPNSLEYWGPTGMVFFRNIQIRYSPLMTSQDNLAFALEAPGASADQGELSNRIELQNVKAVFNVPDLTAHYRYTGNWGYVQLGGIVGSIKWRDVSDSAYYQLNGSAVRWGGALSTNINMGKKAVLRLQGVYGEGMENYMNDAPVDVGVEKNTSGDTLYQPVKGIALPVWGITAFVDVNWSKYFSSAFGYSVETIDNSDLQSPIAYKQGQYGLVNVLYYPVSNVMAGIEYDFGRRDNFSDGFHSTMSEVRFAFKYNFSQIWSWK
jgi:DcaP outer membrane protein